VKPRSLRVRLLAAAAVSISVALVLAGLGLVTLFGHHVERQLETELETYISELIGRIEPDDQGNITLTHPLSDPRFEEPLSGLYWQIQDDEQRTLIRSRSLWDQMLALPRDKLTLGVVHQHELPGPDDQSLLVREQQIIVFPETDAHRVRIVVAIDRSDLLRARAGFTRDMLPYLLLLAGALMLATWWQVRTGLSPLDRIRRGVMAVRSGSTERLPGEHPDEVQPLVDEINQLLQSRDKAVEDARAWTADLAHGLKTPLTALSADAQRLRQQGQSAMADNLEQLSQSMRQRVDRELIRARLRAEVTGRPQHASLPKAVNGLVNTLRRTPAGEVLDWKTQVPASAEVGLSPADLAELLGNLLDNASRWAKSTVVLEAHEGDGWRITIEDDGPGVNPDQLGDLGQRGLRLDERRDGNGLGLAIAKDIVNAYGGCIEFTRSALGGLAVILALPVAKVI
jgi:signal transduction histidine kinase